MDLGGYIIQPLHQDMATHFSILAWRIQWTEEPGGLQYELYGIGHAHMHNSTHDADTVNLWAARKKHAQQNLTSLPSSPLDAGGSHWPTPDRSWKQGRLCDGHPEGQSHKIQRVTKSNLEEQTVLNLEHRFH